MTKEIEAPKRFKSQMFDVDLAGKLMAVIDERCPGFDHDIGIVLAQCVAEHQVEPLELLIKYAARDQRYSCIDWVHALPDGEFTDSAIQNAAAPDTAKVLAEWHRDLNKQ